MITIKMGDVAVVLTNPECAGKSKSELVDAAIMKMRYTIEALYQSDAKQVVLADFGLGNLAA